jgi:3-oxoacyl-[acyl-carrier protein] reductase
VKNWLSLEGRVAVVTGGARGLGFAAAQRMAQAGAKIAIWDRDADLGGAAIAELGSQVISMFFSVDQTDYESVAKATVDTIAGLGSIDILLNNAGIIGPSASLWECDIAEWRQVVDVDLLGVFHCCRSVVPHMLARNYGRIINVASVAGKEGNPTLSAYSAAKAGVIGLTKSLGKELARTGVLVNAIAPAIIKTAMMKDVPDDVNKALISKIPMDRLGDPEEFAAMAHWLASDQVSFSTAAVFDLSGGRATY